MYSYITFLIHLFFIRSKFVDAGYIKIVLISTTRFNFHEDRHGEMSLSFFSVINPFHVFIQEVIELRLDKRPRKAIGAPLGKKVIIFIDDVNMPKLDQYGAQPTIELLRYIFLFLTMLF